MNSPLCLSWLILLLGGAGWAAAQQVEKPLAERVATLEDKRITESSGIIAGIDQPSVFWTLNDSGGEPCLFAITIAGKTRAKVRLKEAANFDWEAITIGRSQTGSAQIFVGDIGDNFHLRPTIHIYQIPEPALPAEADADKEVETAPPQLWHASYPDGPRNSESLLMHPTSGRLYVISKSDAGHSALYAFPPKLVPEKAMMLEKIADVELPSRVRIGKRPKDASQVSDACFSPSGDRIAIATYSYIYEWEIGSGETVADALGRPARLIEPPLL